MKYLFCKVKEGQETLNSVLTILPEGIILLDNESRKVEFINNAFAKMVDSLIQVNASTDASKLQKELSNLAFKKITYDKDTQ